MYHGITESSESNGNVRSIVYKTQNIWILLTNHGLVTEKGPTPQLHNHGKVCEFREMFT